jgi:hypothetical protein
MFHGCEIQKKYNKAIREGRFREIQGDRRRCEEDSEESRLEQIERSENGIHEIEEDQKSWEIREDSEQGVHGRYKKIQYGMFTGETGRSVGNAECYGERWGDSARTQGDPGRIQGDSGEI